jgi:choline dehydrogenase-like flavoprotein
VSRVVVIGSGAGGGVVASELATAGVDVTLLEKGRWIDLARESPLSKPTFELEPHPLQPTEAPYVPAEPEPIEEIEELRSIRRGRRVNAGGRRLPAKLTLVNGVGGATLRYQGVARRLPLEGWPVGDLSPWYERVERTLGVNRFAPSHVARQAAPAFARRGWTLESAPLALLARAQEDRAACVACAGCTYGCPSGAKSSVDLAYIRPAMKTGRLTVIDRAAAFRIEKDGVLYHDADGREQKVTATIVVVSAGAVETARLLLLSGLSGPVGRRLTSSLYLSLTVLVDGPMGSHRGPPMDGISLDFEREGYLVGISQSVVNLLGPMAYARRLSPPTGSLAFMKESFGNALGLVASGGAVAQESNGVTLSAEKDARGVPKAAVTLRLHPDDIGLLRRMRATLDAVASELKGATVEVFSSYDQAPGGAEVRGGCPMGRDPATSVVDPDLCAHGQRNLFVVDGSVFPDARSGNPSLTIQALAARAADHIRRRL